MNPWPLLRAELSRARFAVVAIIAIIALAVALGISVNLLEGAARRGSARAADRFDILIGAPGSATQLLMTTVFLQPAAVPLVSGDVLKRLQADPGVAMISPIAFGDRYLRYPVIGAAASFLTTGGGGVTEGRVFERMGEVVIGAAVDLKLGQSFTPIHGQMAGDADDDDDDDDHAATGAAAHHHEHTGVTYKVVGRLAPTATPWDRAIVVPVEDVWNVHALPTGHPAGSDSIGGPWEGDHLAGLPAIVVKPKSVADAYRIRAAFRGRDSMAIFPAEILVEFYGYAGQARDLLSAVAFATEGVVFAAVVLTMLAALAARRKQIAVLRALGASRGYVFTTLWLGVALTIGTGAILGFALGIGAAAAVAHWLGEASGVIMPLAVGGREILTLAGLLAVGLLLALLPAALLYRQPIAEGLRR